MMRSQEISKTFIIMIYYLLLVNLQIQMLAQR